MRHGRHRGSRPSARRPLDGVLSGAGAERPVWRGRTLAAVGLLASAIALAGCAGSAKREVDSPASSMRDAEIQAEAGFASIQKGDWDTARLLLARALINAERGKAPPAGQALLNYQYGRTLGVACAWEEAERHLQRAAQLDEQRGASPHLAIYELALMKQHQRRYDEAVKYFQQLIPMIEKQGLRETYPWGVADAYDRLASSLMASGRMAEAVAPREEAQRIRAAHPTAEPFGILTPYGSACARAPA